MIALKLNDSHRRLLGVIRQERIVTRVELSRLVNMGSGPVTQITRDLLLSGLILEGDRLRGRRGQPALPLMLNPHGAISFGVSLSPGRIMTLAANFAGEVLGTRTTASADQLPEQVAEIVGVHIEEILKQRRFHDRSRIVGVGFALPGYFHRVHQHMEIVGQGASWSEPDLARTFAARLTLPCWLENDATAAAIGEYYQNGQRSQHCLVNILINYGIGAGLIINGQPFRGAFGNAGEIGAFFPLDRPRPSGTDLLAQIKAAGIDCASLADVTWDNADHARIGTAWAARAGEQLANLIASAWSWLDPDVIAICGAVPRELLQLLAASCAIESLLARQPSRPHPRVVASTQGPEVVAIGASHLPLHNATGFPLATL